MKVFLEDHDGMNRRNFLKTLASFIPVGLALSNTKQNTKQIGKWIKVEDTWLKIKPMSKEQLKAAISFNQSFSEYLENQILTHLLRCDNQSPIYMAILKDGTNKTNI